jgi:hypothetical protein
MSQLAFQVVVAREDGQWLANVLDLRVRTVRTAFRGRCAAIGAGSGFGGVPGGTEVHRALARAALVSFSVQVLSPRTGR